MMTLDFNNIFLSNLRNQMNVNQPQVQEPFSLDRLMDTYKALEADIKAWKASDNYIGTRPEEGRLLTINKVQCLIWMSTDPIGYFYIRLIHPSHDEAVNRQHYQSIIAELDRQGVVAKRYG